MAIRFDEAVLNETVFLAGDAAKLKISSKSAASAAFRGGNAAHISILYKTADGNDLGDMHMQTILNLVGAIKRTEADVAIINAAAVVPCTYLQLKKQFEPSVLLCLGLCPEDIGLHLICGKNITVHFDGRSLLFTESPDKLDRSSKQALWSALQKLFQLS